MRIKSEFSRCRIKFKFAFQDSKFPVHAECPKVLMWDARVGV